MPIKFIHQKAKNNPGAMVVITLIAAFLILGTVRGQGGDKLTTSDEQTLPVVTLIDLLSDNVLAESIKTTGRVEAGAQIDLRSEVNAPVSRTYVELGQSVQQGQLLVTLSGSGVAARYDSALAELERAQAALAQYDAQIAAQEALLTRAEVARTAALSNAQTSLEQAQNNLRTSRDGQMTQSLRDATQAVESYLESMLSSVETSIRLVDDAFGFDPTKTDDGYEFELSAKNQAAVRELEYLYNQVAGEYAVTQLLLSEPLTSYTVEQVEDTIDAFESLLNDAVTMVLDVDAILNDAVENGRLTTSIISTLQSRSTAQRSVVLAEQRTFSTQKQALNSAITANSSLSITYNQAVQSLQDTDAQTAADVAASNAQLQQIKASKALQEASISAARAGVRAAAAELAKYSVRAPVSGKIAELPVNTGELIRPGDLLARVINTSGIVIKTAVSGPEAAYVSPGQPAQLGGGYDAIVTHVSPSINPDTRKVEVHLAVVGDTKGLIIDDVINVTIERNEEAQSETVLLIPLESVRTTASGASVFVVTDENILEEVPVSVGRIIGDRVEVYGIEELTAIVASVRGRTAGEEVSLQ